MVFAPSKGWVCPSGQLISGWPSTLIPPKSRNRNRNVGGVTALPVFRCHLRAGACFWRKPRHQTGMSPAGGPGTRMWGWKEVKIDSQIDYSWVSIGKILLRIGSHGIYRTTIVIYGDERTGQERWSHARGSGFLKTRENCGEALTPIQKRGQGLCAAKILQADP